MIVELFKLKGGLPPPCNYLNDKANLTPFSLIGQTETA